MDLEGTWGSPAKSVGWAKSRGRGGPDTQGVPEASLHPGPQLLLRPLCTHRLGRVAAALAWVGVGRGAV